MDKELEDCQSASYLYLRLLADIQSRPFTSCLSLHIIQFGTPGCRALLSRPNIPIVSYCELPSPSEDLTTEGPHDDDLFFRDLLMQEEKMPQNP